MREAEGGKTGLSPLPQYFNTDRSKAVLLLWFLTVTCSCCPYLYFDTALMLVIYFVNFRWLNDHLFGKELFIRFTASAFRKLLSIYVFNYFPFGFEGRMLDLTVSVPDRCLSFYFVHHASNQTIPVFCTSTGRRKYCCINTSKRHGQYVRHMAFYSLQ